MEWMVKHIQQGECHYVEKYINEVIEKKRDSMLYKIQEMEKLFDELEENKREKEKKIKKPCKCPNHPNKCPEVKMNPWRLENCRGKHNTDYMDYWKLHYQCK